MKSRNGLNVFATGYVTKVCRGPTKMGVAMKPKLIFAILIAVLCAVFLAILLIYGNHTVREIDVRSQPLRQSGIRTNNTDNARSKRGDGRSTLIGALATNLPGDSGLVAATKKLVGTPQGTSEITNQFSALLAAAQTNQWGRSVFDPATKTQVRIEHDGKTVGAYDQDGSNLWSVNVIALFGPPAVGVAEVSRLKLRDERVLIVFGKHSFASVDLSTGKAEFLGSD